MKENLRKYLVEFIGTFFLVLTVGSAVLLGGSAVIAPIAIGFALMIMVYAGGHISGGHYNPAVSFAAAIRGALEWKQVLPYWIFQVLGAGAAAYLVSYFATSVPETAACPANLVPFVVGEFLFTFALCYVVLQVATSKKTAGNSYYGLAIGSTVTVGAFAVGALCLGAFNPAVAVALGIFKATSWCGVGIIAATNLVAALCAGIVYKCVDAE